jgi:hypothetical protein
MTGPTCGAQLTSNAPSSVDWYPLGALGVISGMGALVYNYGIPGLNNVIGWLSGQPVVPSDVFPPFVGAAAVVALVLYYAIGPGGYIRPARGGIPGCLSGIVQSVTDTSDPAINLLFPFAIPAVGYFDVVVASIYWSYVTDNNASWVNCSPAGGPMLRCVVQDETANDGRTGAFVGVVIGAVGGIVLGTLFLAACALAFFVCVILAVLIAITITYAGSLWGGWGGQGIGTETATQNDEGLLYSIGPGMFVTVKGNFTINPDTGYNELHYVTDISPSMTVLPSRGYTTADADAALAKLGGDDCSTFDVI